MPIDDREVDLWDEDPWMDDGFPDDAPAEIIAAEEPIKIVGAVGQEEDGAENPCKMDFLDYCMSDRQRLANVDSAGRIIKSWGSVWPAFRKLNTPDGRYLNFSELVIDLATIPTELYNTNTGRWKGGRAPVVTPLIELLRDDTHPYATIRPFDDLKEYLQDHLDYPEGHNPPPKVVEEIAAEPEPPIPDDPWHPANTKIVMEDALPAHHRFDEVQITNWREIAEFARNEGKPKQPEPERKWKHSSGLYNAWRYTENSVFLVLNEIRRKTISLFDNRNGNYKPAPILATKREQMRRPSIERVVGEYGSVGALAAQGKPHTNHTYTIMPPSVVELEDNREMMERVLDHLDTLVEYPGLEITYLQKRMVLYGLTGHHAIPDNNNYLNLTANKNWIPTELRQHATTRGDTIFLGEAWAIRFLIGGKNGRPAENLLADNWVVFATPEQYYHCMKHGRPDLVPDGPDGSPWQPWADLLFICSGSCARNNTYAVERNYKVDLQTPHQARLSLFQWIIGPFQSRMVQNGASPFLQPCLDRMVYHGALDEHRLQEQQSMLERIRNFNQKHEHFIADMEADREKEVMG